MGSSITRRRLLIVSGVSGIATSLTGCVGDEDPENQSTAADRENGDEDTNGTDDEEIEDENSGDVSGIKIESSVSEPRPHDEVSEEVVEHPNPEGFRWIVVEFELITGSFDANDIMGLTQVDVQGERHFTRAVEITSPDEEFLTSPDDSYMMEPRTVGKAYYRVSGEADSGEWVVEQLGNQHGDVEVREIQ